MYPIPATLHRDELVIARSRFITSIAHAETTEQANAFIAQIKAEFPNASHNCWAYVAGAPADSARVGMSDDGEPHGTAGKPMLTVLLHCEVGEIVAVVTRYFGGTKLGTGGLVKAYSGAVKHALETLPLSTKQQYHAFTLNLDYSQLNAAKALLESHDGIIKAEHFVENVCLTIALPEAKTATFVAAINDLTRSDTAIKALTD